MAQAQIQIESPGSVETAIQQMLEGPGVTISNVQMERWAGVSQVAIFRNGTENTGTKPNIGIESGMVLSTGDTSTLTKIKKDPYGYNYGRSTTEEHDLLKLLNKPDGYVHDAVVITFDLIPTTNNITINFAFGSDEYEHYVGNENYLDAYGFFISGPGIHGTFTDNAVNIAQLPNGDPFSTNYINRNRNTDYYIRNPDVTFDHNWYSSHDRGNHVALNGWTKVITSYLPVQVGKTYRVKIALGDGGDGTYDSNVFIGQFKSERQLAGRVFHHRDGTVNEQALAEGDETYRYFQDARVVLFNNRGVQIQETRTGPRGEYHFTVEKNKNYQIAVDASTLTVGDDYPEQTWSSQGGQCTNGTDSVSTLEHSGFCYGGKAGSVQDALKNKNNSKFAEHLILVDAGHSSKPNLNFAFSFDVVTHTGDSGQGSLRSFILNANAGLGSGEMLFVPTVPANNGAGWNITLKHNKMLPAITRENAVISGRAWLLSDPGQPVTAEIPRVSGVNSIVRVSDLELTSVYPHSSLITLNGPNQTITNMALNGNNRLKKPLIRIARNCDQCVITRNHLMSNLASGVVAQSGSHRYKISKNHFYQNLANGEKIPIDVGEDGINANLGDSVSSLGFKVDRPIIEALGRKNDHGPLIITGFAPKGSQLELYQLSSQGYQFLIEVTEGSSGDLDSGKGDYLDPVSGARITQERFEFEIGLTALAGYTPELAAIAIDSRGNTSEFSPVSRDGAELTAIVWHDLNKNSTQDNGEPGISGVKVRVKRSKGGNAQTMETVADGGAYFTVIDDKTYEVEILPDQAALNGFTLGPGMANPSEIDVDDDTINKVWFGYVTIDKPVHVITLTPEHSKSTASGIFVRFPHTLIIPQGGSVELVTQWLSDENPDWPLKLEKLTCDSNGSSPTAIDESITLIEGESLCFQAVFFVPAETSQGVRGSLEIKAIVSNGQESETVSVIDQIIVSDQVSGRLKLTKTVHNLSVENSPEGTNNTAGSGDILRYTIGFENIGAGPLTSLKIMDDTPAFTSLSEPVQCQADSLPPILARLCRVQTLGADNKQGFRGRIIWHFDGKDGSGGEEGVLLPGAKGKVSYELMVE